MHEPVFRADQRQEDRAAWLPLTASVFRSEQYGTSERTLKASTGFSERSDKRSVLEIVKPGQNQPLYNSKGAIAVETPNMSAPFVASSGPSNRHEDVIS